MEKIKRILKNKKLYLIFGVVIYMLIILSYYNIKFEVFNKQYDILKISNDEQVVEKEFDYLNLKDSNEICQEITIDQNNFSGFSIKFNGKYAGKAVIGIKNSITNEIVKEWNIQEGELSKTNIKYFYFNKIEESLGNKYSIYIKYDKINENTFLPKYITNLKDGENNKLLINNQISENKILSIETMYKRESIVNLYNVLKYFIIITLIIVLIAVVMIKNLNIEKLFLITIPILSILFLITVPVGRNHDEISHYKRAVEVSKGILVTPIQNVENGDPRGEWLNKVYQDIEIDGIEGNYTDVYNALKVKYSDDQVAFNAVFGAAQYSPIAYIPSAFGILISKQIFTYPMISLYMGRIFNLIITLGLLYFSLKLLPKYKSIFYVIMLSPAFLTSIASISADGLTLGVAFLLISYIFNICYNENKKCTTKDLIFLLFLGVLLALLKTGYIPLIFLTMMIPKRKFINKEKYGRYLIIAIILISILTNIFWYLQTRKYATIYTGDVNVSNLNMQRIINQPIEYVKTFIYTNVNNINRHLPEMYGSLFLRMV